MILDLAGSYLTPAGQTIVIDSITQTSGRAGISVLGVTVLLWGVFRVFRALDTAFSTIYGTHRKNGILNQFRDGVVVLISLGVALGATIVATLALRVAPALPFPSVVNPLLLIIGLTIAFFPVYYVFPDRDLSVGEVLPGTVIAAVGWTVLEVLFGVYVAYSSAAELYGVIGGVLLLITWLYFGAVVILIGAVTNAVLGGDLPTSSERVTSAR